MEAFDQVKVANRVLVARDGSEALEWLIPNLAAPPVLPRLPDLILLDLNLPKVDGRSVLRRIKTHPRTREIPIVVLTQSDHDEDIEYCRRLNVHHYIVKPVNMHSLSRVTPQLNMSWALLSNASA